MDFEQIKKIVEIDIKNIKGANILGFHLEGPYISEKYKGAQNSKFIRKPDYDEFSKLNNVSMVTIAPELDGAYDFIKKCNCVVSLGHTDADYDTSIKAINAGAECITHIFNAMSPLNHRSPGAIGAAIQKNTYIQVICDGIHIHSAVVNMLYKLFGTERMILISDSMRATGLADGEYDLGGQRVIVKGNEARLSDGVLAGSVSTLMDCVKHAIDIGIPEKDAFRMASETPANLLQLKKGRLQIGYDADFIVVDTDYNVVKTVVASK